jgi:outer membrane lipoprotein-sorting protein
MSNNHDRERDLQLDNHIAALRDEPTPDGPSPQLMQMTMKRIDSVTGRRTYLERLVHMSRSQKIAAVVMVTLGALVLYFMFTLFSATSSVALADVVRKITSARTLSYVTTVTLADGKPSVVKTHLADPDMIRAEMPDGGMFISQRGAMLILDSKKRTATHMEISGQPAHQSNAAPSIVSTMKALADVKGQSLGEKTIDGVAVKGFHIVQANRPVDVWADKKTGNPVRVELTMPMGDKELVMVMDHFEIDPPLDESLFSLDPPAGYKLITRTLKLPKVGKVDEAMAALLGDYAKASGGTFPGDLHDFIAFAKVDPTAKATTQRATTQTSKIAATGPSEWILRVGAVIGALESLPNGYGYAGKGVKLGEAEKVIFWFKPKDSNTYRAVFGDLHIADVTADKVPSTQTSTIKRPAKLPVDVIPQ